MSKEVARLRVAQLIMPAAVEVRVGDLLQYAPLKNVTPAEVDFLDPRFGMMVKITEIVYTVEERIQTVADHFPNIVGEMYLSLNELKFAVVFQDKTKANTVTFEQQTKVELIEAIHFWNMDPRPSAI